MALTIDSKVKELMKNPKTADLLEQYTPGFKTNPQMKLVGALTFRKLAALTQILNSFTIYWLNLSVSFFMGIIFFFLLLP